MFAARQSERQAGYGGWYLSIGFLWHESVRKYGQRRILDPYGALEWHSTNHEIVVWLLSSSMLLIHARGASRNLGDSDVAHHGEIGGGSGNAMIDCEIHESAATGSCPACFASWVGRVVASSGGFGNS